MTDITVSHDPASGAATIAIRGADITETRFRLRDPYSEKYLTRRGWTKTASLLPGEAVITGDVTTIGLDAELARKITPGIKLSLEQPAADFQEIVSWPAQMADTVAEQISSDTEPAMLTAVDTPATPVETQSTPEPLMLDSFEPSIMHDDLNDKALPAEEANTTPTADNDNRPSTWKPAAIAAGLFFVLGLGFGSFWLGSDSAAIRDVRQTAAMQLEKQKWDFEKQLKQARQQTASVSPDNAETSDARIASKANQIMADRDAARKALAEKEKSVSALQRQLTDANARLNAAKNAAGDASKAQIEALDARILSLTAERDKAREDIAARDSALRDAQARLSVANIQIDALKVVASKTTQAGLEKTALSEKVAQLSAELDKTSQTLSDREQALADATDGLRDAETKLAAADKRNVELVAEARQSQTRAIPATGENAGRLQEERNLYADELKTMTGNFSALQAERTRLERTVATLQSELKQATLTTSQIPSKAVWGATAIDRTGAIYSLQNQIGEKVAEENVAAMCRGKSGSRCETLATYNNACFSVARFQGEGPTADNFAYFVHKDWKTASQTALERCRSMGTSCTVRFTACSPDALSKPISE